jgi:hypothetical protein
MHQLDGYIVHKQEIHKAATYVALIIHIEDVSNVRTYTILTHVITFQLFYFLKLLTVMTCQAVSLGVGVCAS